MSFAFQRRPAAVPAGHPLVRSPSVASPAAQANGAATVTLGCRARRRASARAGRGRAAGTAVCV